MLVGILIGGLARRMNGVAKGMLVAPDGNAIAARTRDLFLAEGARVVLLGKNPAYESLAIPSFADEEDAEGPLAGLLALVRQRGCDDKAKRVFLVGADMPHLTRALVHRLVTTTSHAIAPKIDFRWEPLFSSFDLSRIQDNLELAVASGARSPSAILDALHADTLAMSRDEIAALHDWDTPEDVARVS